jgi:hypothetical protein
MGTYLTIIRKASANLYYLRGNHLTESLLKYLSLRNTKSRVYNSNSKDVVYSNLLEHRFLVISHQIKGEITCRIGTTAY